jgi:cytochrome P450
VRRQLGLGQPADPACTDAQIRAILSGMVTGFVPTDTMAAGHMLEILLKNREAMLAARAAALADDDDLLRRCLFEAMRFKPLNPGPFRRCVKACTVAAGTWRARRFSPGDQILAGTWPAMFDERRYTNPDAFDADRPESQYMLYGYGLHWCIGAPMANVQITQSFKALLKAGLPRPVAGEGGEMRLFGPFPHRLIVEWSA